MKLLRSKEEDASVLEEEARQILTGGSRSSAEGCTLRQETRSIKSDIATLLQLADDQILRMRQAATSSSSITLEIQRIVDSFKRKEMLIGRRPLPIEAESVDDEINHITSLQRQVDTEVDAVMLKVDEQKRLYAGISDVLPAELMQAVSELDNVKTRILVRLVVIFKDILLS